jgi:hypothetical protein
VALLTLWPSTAVELRVRFVLEVRCAIELTERA